MCVCVSPLLQSRRLVSWSYFCLYLSWMAGSYEIITFLSVPWSCVRQASRLPNQHWAWAAVCRHITHFITHTKFPQAATFIHIQHKVTHTHTQTPTFLLFILRVRPPWQPMEKQSKLWSIQEQGGNDGAACGGDIRARECVCVVCLRWCDISGLTWSGTLPPRAWRELPGKDTDGGPGSPGGGGFMVWTKSPALRQKRPVKHKLELPHYLPNAFLNIVEAENIVHMFILLMDI